MIRVHRIPFSTNVERVALAAAHKGVEVEWVDHDAADRSAIEAFSGQSLVPVAEVDGDVVRGSMRIVERLEADHPHPPLYPDDPLEAARKGGGGVEAECLREALDHAESRLTVMGFSRPSCRLGSLSVGDDGTDRRIDVFRDFALGGEQRDEGRLEVGLGS